MPIKVSGLEASYGDEKIIKNVSLDVSNDELCVVIGPSGSGKSTLLKCIAGLVKRDGGTVDLGQQSTKSDASEIGYVFQDFEKTLFQNKTVFKNVSFSLEQQELDRESIEDRVDNVLETLSITELRNQYPPELSGGQQQRVELARHIVRECDVMLLDDPLSDLDYKLQKKMELMMLRMHKNRDSTFLYITHNQDQALKLADKVIVLNHGQVEQVGTPTQVYSNPDSAFVARFVGDSNLFDNGKRDSGENCIPSSSPGGQVELSTVDADSVSGSFIIIRPESLTINPNPKNVDNTTSAQIVYRTYTGEQTEYTCVLKKLEDEILVVEPGRPTWEVPNNDVTVGWDQDDVVVLSKISVTNEETIETLLEV